jgi:DNA-binding response OmpR family regulator
LSDVTKRQILIIDDDRTTVDLLSAFLRHGGYDVSRAFDAMQGFSVANHAPPALIVLDVNLPAGGGFRVLERLGASIRTNRIPVLIVTASLDAQLAAALRGKGASEVLAKPVDQPTLLATVGRLLGETPQPS